MQPHLRSGEHVEEHIHRAEAAGQRDERIGLLGRTTLAGETEEYEDFVDLWEVYLPRHKLVLTLVDDQLTGAGPIAVSDRIEPFLPRPQVVRRDSNAGGQRATGDGTTQDDFSYDLDYDRPRSIGRLRGFQGNYGVFVRSYAYICSLGAPGLREVSEIAVLNANYLLARLREEGVLEHLPVAYERLCMHEFVLSGAPMKRDLGIKTLDLAKRLLDHGVHPPTVYFPLIVDEALLIEPTETETRETLDRFASLIAEILREAAEDPEIARGAPYATPVRRLDEAGAARRPVVRQEL